MFEVVMARELSNYFKPFASNFAKMIFLAKLDLNLK